MVSPSKMCRLCVLNLIQWTCAQCFLLIESTTIQTNTLSKNIAHIAYFCSKTVREMAGTFLNARLTWKCEILFLRLILR